jgi:hypothetical protein
MKLLMSIRREQTKSNCIHCGQHLATCGQPFSAEIQCRQCGAVNVYSNSNQPWTIARIDPVLPASRGVEAKWRPITSSLKPFDGEDVLAAYPDKCCEICTYDAKRNIFTRTTHNFDRPGTEPLYWRPLPIMPKELRRQDALRKGPNWGHND